MKVVRLKFVLKFPRFSGKLIFFDVYTNAGLIHHPVAALPATTLVRAPAHDSAIIRSDRLGGNFAYSTVEGHAYAAITPVVQRVATPVAVSHTVAAPAFAYHAAPALTYATLEAPKVEIKAVEAPKAFPLAYPFAHHQLVLA